MNTEGFTGKAQAYAAARPGYPDESIVKYCRLHKCISFRYLLYFMI